MPEVRDLFHNAEASALQGFGDVLDVGILGVDRDLVVTAWNHWLESATGKLAADVVGQRITDVDERLKTSALSAFDRAVHGATVVMSQRLHGYFIEMPPPPGYDHFDRMQQSARVVPVHDGEGTTTGAIAIIEDVTERVARELELRTARDEAEQANRAKSNFLAAMSHELRTPIGAMTGYADLLAESIFGQVSDLQREQLLRIKSVGAHLVAIVEQILTYARIEAGHETVNYAVVAPRDLARQATNAIEPLASKKQLALECDVAAATPEMTTDVVKVRQVLINLLGNAVKFTEKGTVSLTVRGDDPDVVTFEIRDTGPGIAPRDQARIFDPFVQVEGGATRTHNGTGLGLSVSRELVRLLQGDITLESQVGVGSTFTLTLPRVPASGEPA